MFGMSKMALAGRVLEIAAQARWLSESKKEKVMLVRNALGIWRAFCSSPNASWRGLVCEALGIEDPHLEYGKIMEIVDFLKRRLNHRTPEVIVTLGSGLGGLADKIQDAEVIPYSEIPCFPRVSEHVAGHAGNLVVGRLGGKTVAAMQGRLHGYQGVTPREMVRLVRSLIVLGASHFIVTNAAGGINKDFKPGDLMLIRDDYNFGGLNPLVGPNIAEFGPRFPDMSKAYHVELMDLARDCAKKLGMDLKSGVYGCNLGPNYERPHEILKVLQSLGIDAIGMSTVPEVLAVNHFNAGRKTPRVKILGITLITNLAAGISKTPLSHEEVKEAGDKAAKKFQALVARIIEELR